MNPFSSVLTTRTPLTSSLLPKNIDTTQKYKDVPKRFSYQQARQNTVKQSYRDLPSFKNTCKQRSKDHYQNEYQCGKQNMPRFSKQHSTTIKFKVCVNHNQSPASYQVLKNSPNPVYLCQRCAVLVASKGFQVQRSKPEQSINLSKTDIQEGIKQLSKARKHTFLQLDSIAELNEKHIIQVQKYFNQINKTIQIARQQLIQQLVKQRKQIQNIRQNCNNFYVNLVDQSKKIAHQFSNDADSQNHKEIFNFLQKLKKTKFPLQIKNYTLPLGLPAIQDTKKSILNLIGGRMKQQKQHSPLRSLQLSFDQSIESSIQSSDLISGNLLTSRQIMH